jgi:hypothetical protein
MKYVYIKSNELTNVKILIKTVDTTEAQTAFVLKA